MSLSEWLGKLRTWRQYHSTPLAACYVCRQWPEANRQANRIAQVNAAVVTSSAMVHDAASQFDVQVLVVPQRFINASVLREILQAFESMQSANSQTY